MNKIRIKAGVYGPRHDPYSFTEYTVDRPIGLVTLHVGLGVYAQIGKDSSTRVYESEAYREFERVVGVDVRTLERAACRQRGFRIERGGRHE